MKLWISFLTWGLFSIFLIIIVPILVDVLSEMWFDHEVTFQNGVTVGIIVMLIAYFVNEWEKWRKR